MYERLAHLVGPQFDVEPPPLVGNLANLDPFLQREGGMR